MHNEMIKLGPHNWISRPTAVELINLNRGVNRGNEFML